MPPLDTRHSTLHDQRPAAAARRDAIRPPWLAGVVIVVLTCAAYVPAMRGGFVWDDREHLLVNPVVQDDTPRRIWLTPDSTFEYYPVTWTSYWVEHRLWGMDPTGYHVVNVLLHAAGTLLLWRVLRRLAIPAALLVALLFALHPVNVESVAWVTQRKNILSMFFLVAALLAYLRFDDGRPVAWYLTALASFALAMLSKSGVIGLPLVLLLLAWWRRGTVGRRDVWRVVPFLAVAVVATLIQQPVRDAHVIGESVVRDDPFFARLAGAGWAVWFYLYKAVLPINLSFVYPRWQIDPTNPIVYAPGAALGAVAILCWRMRGGWGRPALFAMVYGLVMVGPALGFVDFYYLRYSFVADHYQYYSIIAVIGLLVPIAMSVLRPTRAAGVAAAVLVLGFGFMTYRQSTPYRTEYALWRDTLLKNPDAWLAHHNLGNLHHNQGRQEEAIEHLRRAIVIKPDLAEAHYNLANALVAVRRHGEAIDHLRQAIALDPRFTEAHNTLGYLLLALDRVAEAIDHLQSALDIQKDHVAAHVNMGNALGALGRLDDAVARLEHAISLDPGEAEAYYNLGVLLVRQGRTDDAMLRYDQVLKIVPNHAEAHMNLGKILLARGRARSAIGHFRQAAEARPDMASAHRNWGLGLAAAGQIPQAAERFREALRIDPRSADLHHDLALAMHVLGRFEEAMTHYRAANRIQPDRAVTLHRLAWLMATHPGDAVRDADEAVRFARRAVELSGHRNVDALDALGAAYASAGDFERAAEAARAALARLGSAKPRTAESIRKRLQLYQNHKTYHELTATRPTARGVSPPSSQERKR